jgi:hypothetical protein
MLTEMAMKKIHCKPLYLRMYRSKDATKQQNKTHV